MIIGVGTSLLLLIAGLQEPASFTEATDAILAALNSSRAISGTESWVDPNAPALPVAKKYTDALKYEEVPASQRAYWLPCFAYAKNWEKTLEWSDRLYREGTLPQQRGIVAHSALTASLERKDADGSRDWYWRSLDADPSNSLGTAQVLCRPVATLLDSAYGRHAAVDFLQKVDKWRAGVKQTQDNSYALAVIESELHLFLGDLANKYGDVKAREAEWGKAMAAATESAWIKAQTKAAITRTKSLGKPLPKLKVLDQKGQFSQLSDLKGKPTIVEIYGGGWSFPEVFRAPDVKSRMAAGELRYARLVWRQRNVDGFLGMEPKEEFRLYTNSVSDAFFIPVEQVSGLGFVRPGAILLDKDGVVRAHLVEGTFQSLQAFLAKADELTEGR